MISKTCPSVLVIGWRIGALRAFLALGAEVWCVSEPGVYARFGQDASVDRVLLVPDCTDIEGVVGALRRADKRPEDFDIVCSQQEFTLTVAALLGAERSPLTLERTLLLRDKSLQKAAIAKAGIPVAQYEIVPVPSDLERSSTQFPRIIKPVLGAASADTFVVNSVEDLKNAAQRLHDNDGWPFMSESFVTGAEHHLDGIVVGGDVKFMSASRYLDNVINVHSGKLTGSVVLREKDNPDLYCKLLAFVTDALAAIGHESGVFHMEVFVDGDHIHFSECAGRVGGGAIERTVEFHHGVDLNLEWAKLVLGVDEEITPRESEGVHGFAVLMAPRAGAVVSIPTREEMMAQPNAVWARPMFSTRHVVTAPNAASDVHIGEVVVEGTTGEDVVKHLNEYADWFRGKVVVE